MKGILHPRPQGMFGGISTSRCVASASKWCVVEVIGELGLAPDFMSATLTPPYQMGALS